MLGFGIKVKIEARCEVCVGLNDLRVGGSGLDVSNSHFQAEQTCGFLINSGIKLIKSV